MPYKGVNNKKYVTQIKIASVTKLCQRGSDITLNMNVNNAAINAIKSSVPGTNPSSNTPLLFRNITMISEIAAHIWLSHTEYSLNFM